MLRKTSLITAAIFCAFSIYAQSFMMQAWYWDYPKPGCNNYSGNSWASVLNAQASDMSGFSHLWLPLFHAPASAVVLMVMTRKISTTWENTARELPALVPERRWTT